MHSSKNPPAPQRSLPLSVIVPLLDEEETLPVLFATLARQQGVAFEVLLCDGGSGDDTLPLARQLAGAAPFPCRVLAAPRGRGVQMNAGAAAARGEWLLFLHADSLFPDPRALEQGVADLSTTAAEGGHRNCAGHFSLSFSGVKSTAYAYYASKARQNRPGCIHGDQGLLLHHRFFEELGGFETDLPFLEDERLAEEVFRRGSWRLLPAEIVTSPRRFLREGLAARQILNLLILTLHRAGHDRWLHELPGLYRSHAASGRLDLAPVFAHLDIWLQRLPVPERCAFWRDCAGFVWENRWQLGLWLDVRGHCRRPPAVERSYPWLRRFAGGERLKPLVNGPLTVAVWLLGQGAFVWWRLRSRRQGR